MNSIRTTVLGFKPAQGFAFGEIRTLEAELPRSSALTIRHLGLPDASEVEVVFVPTQLLVAGSAKFFEIISLKCDDEEQMVNPGAIPAITFDGAMIGTSMQMSPVAKVAKLTVRRNELKPHSWLVRKIRVWLGFDCDPKDPAFCASLLGQLVPKDAESMFMAQHTVPNAIVGQGIVQ